MSWNDINTKVWGYCSTLSVRSSALLTQYYASISFVRKLIFFQFFKKKKSFFDKMMSFYSSIQHWKNDQKVSYATVQIDGTFCVESQYISIIVWLHIHCILYIQNQYSIPLPPRTCVDASLSQYLSLVLREGGAAQVLVIKTYNSTGTILERWKMINEVHWMRATNLTEFLSNVSETTKTEIRPDKR